MTLVGRGVCDETADRGHFSTSTTNCRSIGASFYRLFEGVVIDDTQLFNDKLQQWENFYNFERPHGGLDGQTPYERLRQKTTDPA